MIETRNEWKEYDNKKTNWLRERETESGAKEEKKNNDWDKTME